MSESRLVSAGWRKSTKLEPRVEPGETAALDYYLLPWIDLQLSSLRLRQANGFGFDAFRFDTLEPFFDLAARAPIRGVA